MCDCIPYTEKFQLEGASLALDINQLSVSSPTVSSLDPCKSWPSMSVSMESLMQTTTPQIGIAKWFAEDAKICELCFWVPSGVYVYLPT